MQDEKTPTQSRTIWGLAVIVLGAIATAYNLPDADFQFLADGIQMEDLGPALIAAGYILKEYGQRIASGGLKPVWSWLTGR